MSVENLDAYQVPSFEEWFEARYFQAFDDRYCHGGMSQTGILVHHIRHSREYMQEHLQMIANQTAKMAD
ncbi:hypothetical protein ACTLPN_000333 [Pseudomonas aeruginosa]|nr:hypothetical protein [Pseudomonas aeruginosa]